MNIQTLTTFLMWCTILNGALLVLSVVMIFSAPDLVYALQSTFVPVARDAFDVVFYSILGVFKILWLVFNVVPYVAILIAGKSIAADRV